MYYLNWIKNNFHKQFMSERFINYCVIPSFVFRELVEILSFRVTPSFLCESLLNGVEDHHIYKICWLVLSPFLFRHYKRFPSVKRKLYFYRYQYNHKILIITIYLTVHTLKCKTKLHFKTEIIFCCSLQWYRGRTLYILLEKTN